jgi:two-component system NtrC family sensor kinase
MLNANTPMPLQSKVSLTLVVLISAFVIISYTILRSVIAPAFDELEVAAAKSDLHRAEGALRNDLENLHALTADWAPWDDMYYYVRGKNPGFEKSNLIRPTLNNLGLDLLAVHGAEGRLVWGQVLVGGIDVPVDSFNILNPDHAASAGLVAHASALNSTLGLVHTARGAMIVSSRPILMSDESGSVSGAVVMGQFLNESRLIRARERTEVNMFWEYTDGSTNSGMEPVFQTSPTSVVGRKTISDIHNRPFLVLSTKTPRKISSLGAQTIDAATLFLVVAGILVCSFIWFTLRYTVLRPIERLSRYIDEIRNSGDLSRQLSMSRSDEIGVLGRQFDSMTAEVHAARQALLDQSFKAGKADTAAEVMHNIRNAMTPMINGLERLRKSFRVAGNLRVAEATQQIGSHDCPPERKQKFLEYITASFDHVESVSSNALNDLDVVTAQAKQVEGILSDQEKFANVAPVAENLAMGELLSEAANVIPVEHPGTVEVALGENLDRLRVRAHRIGLLQVMGNLILNAYESIKRSEMPRGKITLAASNEVVDDQPMIRVSIRDNGSGFDELTETKIFQRGFTSKTKGDAAGLGLHWCANAVAGMGGKIMAESAGSGRGAEFHVLLPAAQGG